MEVLDRAEWQARAAAHAARVDTFVRPHLARREGRVKHPVHDFLFTYYSQRPAQLRRWHPGHGTGLVGADELSGFKGYGVLPGGTAGDVVTVTAEHVRSQRPLLESLHTLLTATEGRPANFGCFGMHEWAMVYRLEEDETRHADWPLRLGPAGTDAVVESHKVACSHFDAYRFFTGPARPLNTLRPTSADRPAFEQPACLHAGMDLYKHAFRLTPMISSDVVADCFELARDIRELDMRAAPYDLQDLGFDPVRVETPEGKQEYVAAQRAFAERGAPLRRRLVEECERLLAVAGVSAGHGQGQGRDRGRDQGSDSVRSTAPSRP
ncbi:3-methyladenine DNA glycosylase [Nocardioides sp. Arc9.136]|uniref:3-methyladenine DNA glycosylase n=1 Tax=Nocardioides sp. Arc9.136 TaxID=2996826 RepID=UPI002666B5FC|nr:3-methyladenine DNA glycosylase [Nocardioides sp. Arc9.136]WKN49880.1 3-methyladenine DNA glycosylase [Nocardioides sp. Arc9.136]